MIGAGVTIIVALLLTSGWLEALERSAIDERFRVANSISASPEITLVEISDADLGLVGRWPWTRDTQAAIYEELSTLGARAIIADIEYLEPESIGVRRRVRTRSVAPTDASDPNLIAPTLTGPDTALAEAIQTSGRVYLAFHFPEVGAEETPAFEAIVQAIEAGDDARANALAGAMQQAQRGDSQDMRLIGARARLVARWTREPTLSADEAAAALGIDVGFTRAVRQRCWRVALRRRVAHALRDIGADKTDAAAAPLERAQALATALYEEIVGARPVNETELGELLNQLALQAVSTAATARKAAIVGDGLAPVSLLASQMAPTHAPLAEASAGCGFVNFTPDPGGVVRRLWLCGWMDGATYAQLAARVAIEAQGLDFTAAQVTEQWLTVPAQDGRAITIPLDGAGRVIIPWVDTPAWTEAFPRVLSGALWTIHDCIDKQQRNLTTLRRWLREPMSDAYFDDGADYPAMLTDWQTARAARRAALLAGDVAAAVAARARIEALNAELARVEVQRVTRLRTALETALAQPDQVNETELVQLMGLAPIVEEAEPFLAANRALQTTIDTYRNRLRPMVSGKLCLLGYTAVSLADATPTPTSARAPGVLAHANLLSGLLTGQLVSTAGATSRLALTLACGALATLISAASRRTFLAAIVVALIAAMYALATALVFYTSRHMLPVAGPLVAIAGSSLAVYAYRYVFIERERHKVATALSQYTSREIARQIAENPELARRAEEREVTALFSDLRGFTSIAERIGAEETQRVLNVCLGRFTDAIISRDGMVNKFIGDGVFAFWNPAIFPRPRHANLSCHAALDMIEALETLRVERAAASDRVFDDLAMRVGVATGVAIVGPCGSDQKYDYTCIGDSVNVAARLESANKFFGTRVLITGVAREQAGDDFVCRALGAVRVKGKRSATPVFELLGRAGQVDPALIAYGEKFAAAVARFQAREWAAALDAFGACQAERPDDTAVEQYLEATAFYLTQPPGDDWLGAIELTEK